MLLGIGLCGEEGGLDVVTKEQFKFTALYD
jgi:hypothetical protein